MLKTLIKKQFFECFRSYFVNMKTGKARSKGGVIGMFVFFAVMMLFLCFLFFGMAFALSTPLANAGLTWLYFALMGVISIALGTFGSVFNTYTALYLSKDNELLLSMPIAPSKILLSRMSLVFGLSLLYSGVVWLPAIVHTWIFGSPSPLSVIFGILLLLVIALFVTVLTCALGWLVALLASRLKNKSILVVILSLVFFSVYYVVCFRMTEFMNAIVMNSDAVAHGMKLWGNLLYQLGMAASGNVSAFVIFTGVTVVLFALSLYILSRSFVKIVTKAPAAGKSTAKKQEVKQVSVKSALFRRELKRFTSSPTYMLNSGLGIFILPVLAVAALIKRGDLLQILPEFSDNLPELYTLLPVLITAAVGLIVGMNAISTPSVSLEGKYLWVLRSMPVRGRDVLEAKLNLHVALNIWPTLICMLVLCFCLKTGVETAVFSCLYLWMFIWLTGAFGLILGIKRPNFHWTNETMPIKQSMNVLLAILFGWIVNVLLALGAYLLRSKVDIAVYIACAAIVLALAAYFMKRWLATKGAKIFDSLA